MQNIDPKKNLMSLICDVKMSSSFFKQEMMKEEALASGGEPFSVCHRAAGFNAGSGVAFEVFGLQHYWTPG